MLRVWLPLTKDLRNQGLDDVTITNNGATFNANGKLGGCYYFNRSTPNYLKITNPLTTATNGVSMAFWVKIPSNASGNNQIVHIGNGSGWNNNRCTCFIYQSSSSLVFSCSDGGGSGSANSTQYGCKSSTLTLNEWTHVACTYSTGIMKIYLNGVLDKEYTTSIVPSFTSTSYIGVGAAPNANEPATVYVNDIRIYDHALSPLEVKEISKGLVLHYPLADAYVEATTNLSNSKLSSSCYNAVTQKYSYGTNTDIYKESGTFEGRACEKVHMGTNGLDAFPYVFFDYFQPPIGETRTLSFDYYPTIMDKVVFYSYNSPGNGNYTINYKTPVSWSGSVTISVQLNQWNHITITVTNTGSAASGYGYMQIGNVKHTSNTANYWLFGNIQVEAKDHATGYVGPNGTRSAGTVYDCSGFCNNGTKWAYDTNGIIEIAADTPKYQVSTYINSTNNTTSTASGTQYIYGNCELTTPQYLTVVFWCKPIAGYGNSTGQGQFSLTNNAIGDSAGRDYDTCPMNHRDDRIDMCTSSGTHKTMSITFTANEWHHYAIVYDGRYGRVYKDGVATGQTLDMGSVLPLKDMKGVVIGFSKAGGVWRSNKSYFSDFRIYATALSAEDVKSLYQNSAYIDNQGNIYGAVYEEV